MQVNGVLVTIEADDASALVRRMINHARYSWYVIFRVFVWYDIRVPCRCCVTNELEEKEGQTWNIVHCCVCGKACTYASMISNATINAICAGAPSLNIVDSYSFDIFALLVHAFTPKARKPAGNINVLGVTFACRINTDGPLEMNFWSNANNAGIEEVKPTTWMEIKHDVLTWWYSPVQMRENRKQGTCLLYTSPSPRD